MQIAQHHHLAQPIGQCSDCPVDVMAQNGRLGPQARVLLRAERRRLGRFGRSAPRCAGGIGGSEWVDAQLLVMRYIQVEKLESPRKRRMAR